MDNHFEKLWAALYFSQKFYSIWENFHQWPLVLPESCSLRRAALLNKTMSIVNYDRTIDQYTELMNSNKLIQKL